MDTGILIFLIAAQMLTAAVLAKGVAVNRGICGILSAEEERRKAEREKREQDAVCWEAMQKQADSPAEEKDPDPSKRMDEGFENLMTYEVNLGRGKKTGGEP